MTSINKRDRRPSHEFLSELSISQKHKLTNQRQSLKVKLDKLDVQRRRSLDVLETERRRITASLHHQHLENQRIQQIRSSSSLSTSTENPGDHDTSKRSPDLSTTGEVKLERRLSKPGPLGTPRSDTKSRDQDRPRCTESPDRIPSLSQRRNSDATLSPLSSSPKSVGITFPISQPHGREREPSNQRSELSHDTQSPRRKSIPAIIPTSNRATVLPVARSPDLVRLQRNLERRHSFNSDQSRLCRRPSKTKKKPEDITVTKMAGMHDVMQRTSIFQIQEKESNENSDRYT